MLQIDKSTFVICVDFVTVLEKSSPCDSNLETSNIIEISTHTSCGFSIFVTYSYER